MRRRVVLAGVAGLAAGCVDAASPSGPRAPPSEADLRDPDPGGASDPDDGPAAFRIGEWDFTEGADGTLLVTATVINDASGERRGRFVATVTLDDETVESGTDVSVPPNERIAVELPVDVPFDRFESGGSLSLDLRRAD